MCGSKTGPRWQSGRMVSEACMKEKRFKAFYRNGLRNERKKGKRGPNPKFGKTKSFDGGFCEVSKKGGGHVRLAGSALEGAGGKRDRGKPLAHRILSLGA